MNDSDKVKIYITIAGERIPLTVPADRRGAVRRTEREVADLYDDWHRKFPRKTDSEILAMVAYQFASFYGDLRDRYEAARDSARQLAERLDRITGFDADSNDADDSLD